MFDHVTEAYEALIDWPKRLARESPLLRAVLTECGALVAPSASSAAGGPTDASRGAGRVLDLACGTGHHAALLSDWGLEVEGRDASPAMIAWCAEHWGTTARRRWRVASFTDAAADDAGTFAAVLCLGNSLALAMSRDEAAAALTQMATALRPAGAASLGSRDAAARCPGGVLVLQVLNLARLPDGPPVWQVCKRVTLSDGPHLLVKGVQRQGDRGLVNLIDVQLADAGPVPRYDSTPLLSLPREFIEQACIAAGLRQVECFGGYDHSAYDRVGSTDLLVIARR
jgi:SAM-dependent methyltransferase